MSSYQGIQSSGTVQEVHEYDLFPPTGIHKVGSETPIVTVFENPFDPKTIRNAEVIIILNAPTNNFGSFRLDKIQVNGSDFRPNAIGNRLDMSVHFDGQGAILKGRNVISIFHTAPFGAGTFFVPDTSMSGKVLLQVEKTVANRVVAPAGGTTNLAQTLLNVQGGIKESTPTAIAILVIIAIIIVALAIIVARTGVPKIPKLPKVKIPKVKIEK